MFIYTIVRIMHHIAQVQSYTALGWGFPLVDDVMMRSLSSMSFSMPVENTLP